MIASTNKRVPRLMIRKQDLSAGHDPLMAVLRVTSGEFDDRSERTTPGSVKQVLSGDPIAPEQQPGTIEVGLVSGATVDKSAIANPGSLPRIENLTNRSQLISQAIRHRPAATPSRLSKWIDIATSTVNHRVDKIEGVDWGNWADIVRESTRVLPPGSTTSDASDSGTEASDNALLESEPHGTGPAIKKGDSGEPYVAGAAAAIAGHKTWIGPFERGFGDIPTTSDPATVVDNAEPAAAVIFPCAAAPSSSEKEGVGSYRDDAYPVRANGGMAG